MFSKWISPLEFPNSQKQEPFRLVETISWATSLIDGARSTDHILYEPIDYVLFPVVFTCHRMLSRNVFIVSLMEFYLLWSTLVWLTPLKFCLMFSQGADVWDHFRKSGWLEYAGKCSCNGPYLLFYATLTEHNDDRWMDDIRAGNFSSCWAFGKWTESIAVDQGIRRALMKRENRLA